MRKIKGFSYDPIKDKKIIEYIKKQQNQSKYILNLVNQDMNKDTKDIKLIVKQCIEEYLSNNKKGKKVSISMNEVNSLMNIN